MKTHRNGNITFNKIVLTIHLFALLVFTTHLASADSFSSKPQTFKTNQPVTLRGVINPIVMPVPDECELGNNQVQGGYFLFTPYSCTVEIESEEDPNGQKEIIQNAEMFHIAGGSEKDYAEFEKIKGKPVEVKALMMAAHTRYHRTSIIISVKSVKLLTQSK